MSQRPSSTASVSEPLTTATSTNSAAIRPQSSQSFAELCANYAANTPIRFDADCNIHIIIPNDNCTKSEVMTIAKSIIDTIHAEASVSVASRDQLNESDTISPDTVAKSKFTIDEDAMYNHWENGSPMSHWDFDANVSPQPLKPAKEEKFRLMGLALSQLDKIPYVTPQQARAWVDNY